MDGRLSGAVLILVGCAGMGFSAANLCHTRVRVIRNFLHLLDAMIADLGYRVTPLPELCASAVDSSSVFAGVMHRYSEALEAQVAPNPRECMEFALAQVNSPCPEFSACLRALASVLGCHDLTGQLRLLEGLKTHWNKTLEHMEADLCLRARNLRIFGICAGCALAILLV